MSAKYRLIDLFNEKIFHGTPEKLAAHLLGRDIDNFLIIKTDERGSRLVPIQRDMLVMPKIMRQCP